MRTVRQVTIWQPIGSAPVGDVLVTNGRYQAVAYKHRYAGPNRYGWRVSANYGRALGWQPTHWMPLPPAPEGQSES